MLLFRKKRRIVQNFCPNVLLFLGWQSHTYANQEVSPLRDRVCALGRISIFDDF